MAFLDSWKVVHTVKDLFLRQITMNWKLYSFFIVTKAPPIKKWAKGIIMKKSIERNCCNLDQKFTFS